MSRICLFCHKPFVLRKPSSKQRYCGHSCAFRHIFPENIPVSKTKAVISKRADSRRNRGDAKWYVKRDGRHEHRTVVENLLGRKLRRDEIVHHIDHNKRNNDPSNLHVMSQSEHARLHFTKKEKHEDHQPVR